MGEIVDRTGTEDVSSMTFSGMTYVSLVCVSLLRDRPDSARVFLGFIPAN